MDTIEIPAARLPAYGGPWAVTWRQVCAGVEPAESLPTVLRYALFRTLRQNDWTIPEIGAWTRTTPYTVARILGLSTV